MFELLTTTQMRSADALAIASGVPSLELMENAGRAVADTVIAAAGYSRPVVVCAGCGSNGGDGFVAARLLAERGCAVRLILLGERERLAGDAAEMAQRYAGPVERWQNQEFCPQDIMVDALFGAGLSRPVDGAAAQLVGAINRSGGAVVAVDLPSGINGDTGAVMGCAVKADQTVTFFRRKPGHLLMPGRAHCGRVAVAQIGIPASVLDGIRPQFCANGPDAWGRVFPIPQTSGHKYSRGHAVVLSGEMASTGAARLAARAALRAGSGLVTIASPTSAMVVNAAASLSIMVREAEGADGLERLLADPRLNVVVMGPGGGIGPAMRAKIRAAAVGDRALVLDADALTSFGENPKELFTILANHQMSTAILTPHDGEFDKLFNGMSGLSTVKAKLERARSASHETGAVVVMKGPDTVVAAPDGRAAIADNAPAWLASAGTGDVLAGVIGGLRAQGMPAYEAAAAAVWIHGEAAAAIGPGLIAEDLPEALPQIYRRLFTCLEAP